MKKLEYEDLNNNDMLGRGIAFDTLPSRDDTTDDKIYNLIVSNRIMYDRLKKAAMFNGGHIATYNEILRAGKGHINPMLAIEIAIFIIIVIITMGII